MVPSLAALTMPSSLCCLRHLSSDRLSAGLLSYPYSTRELVNIVRHLEEFPQDSLVHTIENVFAFDNYDSGSREQVHLPASAHTTVCIALLVKHSSFVISSLYPLCL